jgi:N-acetylmuramoyl-L-alanine amidase
MWAIVGVVRLLLSIVALSMFSAPAFASPALDRAKREDAALRRDEDRLRLRDNITRVIDLWRKARDAATTDSERVEASRGLVEAWALLAHWSGREDDSERARAAAERLEIKRLTSVDVDGSTLKLHADGSYEIEGGTYGEHRLYFDLTPVIAVREVLGTVDMQARGLDRARVTQLDDDTVRIIFDFTTAIPEHEASEREIRLKLSTVDSRLSTRERSERREPKRSERPSRIRKLLAIKKVVIDAGHGGKDTGAIGRKRLREKDVNLQIALKLGEQLEKLGVKVAYTRTSDRFVSLEKRASIANRSGADLFISVHANSNRSSRIHGIETYYLNTSSSRYASRLARRENGQGEAPDLDPEEESETVAELPDGALGADLRLILADLAMRSATSQSRRLAGHVQSSMVRSLGDEYGVKDLGVKHALFAVLLGVRMPSVLIETGFVTNAAESERLATSDYQTKIAKAIARGVERFMEERQQLAALR